MLKDKTNQKLLGVLIFLILLYAGSQLSHFRSGSSSVFKTDLVRIDTAAASGIEIEKSGKKISLHKKDNQWDLTTDTGTEVKADADKVRRMLAALSHIRPERVVTDNPDKWRDYQTDSSGTRIQIWEDQIKTLDLVIGRFGMQGQTSFYTYVRPYEADEVYAAGQFSGSSVSSEASAYRNRTILELTPDSVRQLIYEYPEEGRFILSRTGAEWQLEGETLDSAGMAGFVKNLRRISSSVFEDLNQPSPAASPDVRLEIDLGEKENILLRLFAADTENPVIHSSQNPDNFFSDTAAIHKIFWSKEEFLNLPADD